ncbi:MAG: 50S ribosomal protein L22 [Nitrospirota bacterium]
MEAKAILRYTRVTPRKARMVVDLIRGKKVEEAFTILRFVRKDCARLITKLLKSAVANAEDRKIGDMDELWISKAVVDNGAVYKRFMPRAMGRASMIKKRTSHITLVLSSTEEDKR